MNDDELFDVDINEAIRLEDDGYWSLAASLLVLALTIVLLAVGMYAVARQVG